MKGTRRGPLEGQRDVTRHMPLPATEPPPPPPPPSGMSMLREVDRNIALKHIADELAGIRQALQPGPVEVRLGSIVRVYGRTWEIYGSTMSGAEADLIRRDGDGLTLQLRPAGASAAPHEPAPPVVDSTPEPVGPPEGVARLTEDEHQAMALTADLANTMARIIGHGSTAQADLTEVVYRIHAIQHTIMAQAAARAYPDRYRLLGGTIGEAADRG